jgi:transcriptional regulator with GAF, ATPase, and Fis domain
MSRQPKYTKDEIIAALKATDGDLIKAAVALEVTPSTVYRSMQRYGIEVITERTVKAA